jgi:hypothetical protein
LSPDIEVTDEDAVKFMIKELRNPTTTHMSSYGYEVYIPNLLRVLIAAKTGQQPQHVDEQQMRRLSSTFYDAAWELCRRGILRPGVRDLFGQATAEGASGNGYSVTPFGRTWLTDGHRDDFVPVEPGRFGRMIAPYGERFGSGFQARAQQAITCYGARAYLACCAMVGAATESILLNAAIAKDGDEQKVLQLYVSGRGRSKIESLLIGQARVDLQQQVRGFTGLLNYWRDDASHGKPSRLSDDEAFTALAMLLRFAALINDNWAEIVGGPQ